MPESRVHPSGPVEPAPVEYEHRFDQPWPLELGGSLPLTLRYSVWGRPAPDGANVVWVCHALTGSPAVHQWWPRLIGPGRAFDPAVHAIVCVNVPGSCYGSTGPLSPDPDTGRPYLHGFPVFTARDVARAFAALAQHLGYTRLHTLIGGSMGGQHALEWALLEPNRMQHLVLLCCNAVHSPWGIAFDASQRAAIALDPTWRPHAPDAQPTDGAQGMALARGIAMLSYRSYANYTQRQSDAPRAAAGPFRAESYQHYQGQKLIERFNAYTYVRMTQLLDSHDVGRDRGGLAAALAGVRARTLVVGVNQDVLFPVVEQQLLAQHIPDARLVLFDSPFGHDAFLVETEAISAALRAAFPQLQSVLS